MNYQSIIKFWFEELTPKQWFEKNIELDLQIKNKFLDTHTVATQCELVSWRVAPQGRLAEIIVLDQFSRNIYRGNKKSFEFDPIALVLAQEAVSLKIPEQLSTAEQAFLYLPFMHSESKLIHKKAVELFSTPGMERNLDFEFKHKAIIDQFGRYPHRNQILGRPSTPEETAFLETPNSSF